MAHSCHSLSGISAHILTQGGFGPGSTHEDPVVQYNSYSSSSSHSSNSRPTTKRRRIARDAVLKAGVCSAPGTSVLVISIRTPSGTAHYRFSSGIAGYLHSRLGSLLDKQRAASARLKTSQEHQEIVEGTSAEAEYAAGGAS